jgi:hypothetical protein
MDIWLTAALWQNPHQCSEEDKKDGFFEEALVT